MYGRKIFGRNGGSSIGHQVMLAWLVNWKTVGLSKKTSTTAMSCS
jgi:hypothetical protein